MAGEIEKVVGKRGVYYRVRVELPPKPDGKRNQKTLTDVSYKGLEKQQRDLLHQIDHGSYSVAPTKMTLEKFLDDFLEAIKGRRVNTYLGYKQAANAFKKGLGNMLLTEIRADMIQRFVIDLKSWQKDSTVHQRFTKFKTMMKHAVELEYISKNPCSGVIVNKPDVEEMAVWDEVQVRLFDSFLKACLMRYAVMIMLLFKTGARIGELLGLRWTDIDFRVGAIHVNRTAARNGYNPPKTKNSMREVPLDEDTLKLLSKHKIQQAKEKLSFGEGYNPENLVFSTKRGRKIPYSSTNDSYHRIVLASGLPYIPPHGLRHTHITHLLKGNSVKAVAERVGDDPVTIEKTYAHVLPSMREAILKSIEQIYEDKPRNMGT